MKPGTLYPWLIAAFFLLPPAIYPQNFSIKEKTLIRQKADSIVSAYRIYSTFTKNTESISDLYIDAFKHLFSRDSIKIFNDLKRNPSKPFYISVAEYVKLVKEWHPTGLSVEIPEQKIEQPERKGDQFMVRVNMQKSLTGFPGKYPEPFTNLFPLTMDIVFDKTLENFTIAALNHPQFPPDQPVVSNPPDTAKKTDGKKTVTPKTPKAESKKAGNPFSLTFRIYSGSSGIKISGTGNAASTTSGFFYGAGAGFEKTLVMSKKSALMLGLSLVYRNYSSEIHLDSYYGEKEAKDRAGQEVVLMNTLTGVQETVHLSQVELPVLIRFRYSFTGKAAFYLSAGLSAGISSGGKFNSTASGNYEGLYNSLNGFIFSERYHTAYPEFGYDKYNVAVNAEKTNTSGTISAAVTGSAGLEYTLNPGISLVAGFWIQTGLTNTTTRKDGQLLSENYSDLQSILVIGDSRIGAFGFELGLNIKLW